MTMLMVPMRTVTYLLLPFRTDSAMASLLRMETLTFKLKLKTNNFHDRIRANPFFDDRVVLVECAPQLLPQIIEVTGSSPFTIC